MESPGTDVSPVRGRRTMTATSPSLGRTSHFTVHRPAAARLPPSPSAPHIAQRQISPSYARSAHASPAPRSTQAPPHPSYVSGADVDTSQLPLDLLEPAAARWATTARRGSRRGPPRVRSTLGPQSDVVDTGVFVCPNTVVAALYAPPPASPPTSAAAGASSTAAAVVVTAESGGWLRVREQRTGAIRHQQQLRDGGEACCLAWATAAAAATVPVVVVGQLSGLLCFYALVGESLVELPAATCVFHEAPLLTCVALPAASLSTSAAPRAAAVHGTDSALLSLDADGVLGLWSLQTAPVAGHAAAAVVPALAVRLVDCSYACAAAARAPSTRGESQDAAAVVVAAPAAALDGTSTSPWCIYTSHRFAPDPTTAAEDAARCDTSGGHEGDVAAVFLCEFALDAPRPHADAAADGLNATSLEMEDNRGGTVSALAASSPPPPPPAAPLAQPAPCLGWVVRRAYRVPVALLQRRSAVPAPGPLTVTALCVTGHDAAAAAADVQLWAGTADGRLLVWEARTGRFVRALVCASAAPVHHLAAVATPPTTTRGGGGAVTGPALVWASQADGSVVAWSAATYAVAEVLPVSYPPTFARGPDGAVTSADNAAPVVVVRDAVDLLRATRHPHHHHHHGGFTLFVAPMELLCMQRAWSVATDGTVRTWLLPAGEMRVGAHACAAGAGASSRDNDSAAAAPSSPPAVLDAHTVERFLQDQAEVLVRAAQAHEAAQAALRAQVGALQERNGVLAAALQQAIARLERVSGDGLVRSTSRAAESPDRGGGAALQESSVGTPRSPTPSASLSSTSSADRHRMTEAAADPSTPSAPTSPLSPPPRTSAIEVVSTAAPASAPAPVSAAQATHVRTLQSLLEELHARLEESWSRNDALREELLVYQLRTLEREGEMASRVRATTATMDVDTAASAATAAAATPAHESTHASDRAQAITSMKDAAAAAADAAAPLLLPPPPPPAQERTSTATASPAPAAAVEPQPSGITPPPQPQPQPQPQQYAEEAAEPERPPVTPPRLPQTSSSGHSPSRTLRSPSVAELVQRQRPTAPPPLTPPPPLEALMVTAQEDEEAEAARRRRHLPPSVDPHAALAAAGAARAPTRQRSSIAALSTSSAAAHRFLAAASAAVAATGAGGHRRRRVPSPPLLSVAADEDAYAEETEEVTVSTDGGDSEPALVDAWCTSESDHDLSPIPGPAPRGLLGQSGVASADGSSFAAGAPHRPTSSLLSAYPYLSTSLSTEHAAREQRPLHQQPRSAAAQVVATTWASPAREESHRHRTPGVHGPGAYAAAATAAYRAPAATAHLTRDVGAALGGPTFAASGRSAAVRGTPVRRPTTASTLTSASTPHTFHSPIIYRPA